MNSLIPIAAAVVLAMEYECYMIAGGFFALGLVGRAVERKGKKQRQRERIEDQVRLDIEEEKRHEEEEGNVINIRV